MIRRGMVMSLLIVECGGQHTSAISTADAGTEHCRASASGTCRWSGDNSGTTDGGGWSNGGSAGGASEPTCPTHPVIPGYENSCRYCNEMECDGDRSCHAFWHQNGPMGAVCTCVDRHFRCSTIDYSGRSLADGGFAGSPQPECPSEQPVDGTACASLNSCRYAASCATGHADCDGKLWHVAMESEIQGGQLTSCMPGTPQCAYRRPDGQRRTCNCDVGRSPSFWICDEANRSACDAGGDDAGWTSDAPCRD